MATIRVRTKAGVWRFEGIDLKIKLQDFISTIEANKSVKINKVCTDQKLTNEATPAKTLQQLGLKHGSMLFVLVGSGTITVGNTRREIDEDGNIKSADNDKNGFLPGLKALGDQKKNWTLTEMTELQNKHTFVIKGDKENLCSKVSLDTSACGSFVKYISQNARMKQCRCGFLYGRYVDSEEEKARKEEDLRIKERNDKFQQAYGSTKANMDLKDLDKKNENMGAARQGVVVEAIYEPLQENSPTEFVLLEDPREANVELLAKSLGLQKVGFIVSRPRSEKFNDVNVVSHEVIAAAEQSLEASEGKRISPFVCVTALSGANGDISFEAYSLTESCLNMAAEGALGVLDGNPSHCSVVSPYVAIVSGKEAHVVDTAFFIKSVPIIQHASVLSEAKYQEFPKVNRALTPAPDKNAIKNHIKTVAGRNVKTLSDDQIANVLSNFHVLVYLLDVFSTEADITAVGNWVKARVFDKDKSTPFQMGYKTILHNFAGLN